MKIHLIFFLYIIVHICVACAPDMVVSSPDEQNSISLSLDSQGVLNYQSSPVMIFSSASLSSGYWLKTRVYLSITGWNLLRLVRV